MDYNTIKEQIQVSIDQNDPDSIINLITVDNAATVLAYNRIQSTRSGFYAAMRLRNPDLSQLTDEQFNLIFFSDLTPEHMNEELKGLGITISKP